MIPSLHARPIAALGIALLAALPTGCGRGPESTAEYQAACEGPPLRTVEQRNKAALDGYRINERFGCIDKASYAAVAGAKAKRAAEKLSEDVAKRREEREEEREKERERRAAKPKAP